MCASAFDGKMHFVASDFVGVRRGTVARWV